MPADPLIDSVRHPDDRCVGYGFLIRVDDDGHGDAGSPKPAAGNLVRIQKLFDLGVHELIVFIAVAERTPYPFPGNDIDVQIDHNDGKMIPCNVNPERIAGVRDAPEQVCLPASGGFESARIIDQAVRLQLIQIVCDSGKAQPQFFGNHLAGALPVVINQAVNIACVF